MSFTDQKRFVVTSEDTKLSWGGGFWCKLCGHKFQEGDGCRWVYTGGRKVANFLVCDSCDGPDVIDRAESEFASASQKAKQWNVHRGSANV